MAYYIDDRATSLMDLKSRLNATDLIPSHLPLLDGLEKKLGLLESVGMKCLADLRTRLKNKKSLSSLADEAGIDTDYLVLLRRLIEGFFPKPQPLKAFDWLDEEIIDNLATAGVRNTLQFYEDVVSGANDIAKNAGVSERELTELVALSDLSRVQWVSPTFARVLTAAGYSSAAQVASARPDELYEAINQANEGARFYKGKIGLRDIKRLVAAAAYVP